MLGRVAGRYFTNTVGGINLQRIVKYPTHYFALAWNTVGAITVRQQCSALLFALSK